MLKQLISLLSSFAQGVNRKNIIVSVLVVFVSVLFSASTFSWNALGHMVTANITYDNLTPEARAKVDKMVAELASQYPEITHFTQLAIWMDNLRGQKIDYYTHWHYIDLPLSGDGTPVKNISDTDNVIWAINKLAPVVGNAKANTFERARALAFLVHVVEDIHQPLHSVGRITAAHPDGDQGGNLFTVKFPSTKPQTIKLHKLWDQGMDVFAIDAATVSNAKAISARIKTSYPIDYFGVKASNLSAEEWANEGLALGGSVVYATLENQVPSDSYLQTGRQISEQRIAIAGYRLANLLNQLLA